VTARLWWVPGAASLAVHMVLEETGEPYELRRRESDPDGTPPPELLALNPEGRVPVLELDGQVLTESAAICLHLADRHPEAGLVPAPGTPERAELYRRLMFFTNTVQETTLRFFYPWRYSAPGGPDEAVRTRAIERLEGIYDRLEGELDGPYVLGERVSVADHYLSMLVRWGRRLPRPAWERPRLAAHWLRVAERPAVARVLADEELEGRPPAAAGG
jgi:glutathione S-transferase